MRKGILSAVIFLVIAVPAYTCTIFSLYPDTQHWVGRTFDWSYGHGLVYTNKRNVSKKSLRLLPTDVVGEWTSKYGSVTFNQFGREFPTGGMNEAGLVIDALELTTSIFPAADTRPSLNELQFIQYVLDNFSTTEEVLAGLETIRLSPVGSKLHYFVCDVKKCMSIEFIDGKVVTHMNESLPISGLANNTYAESEIYSRRFITFGGSEAVDMESKHSLDRFVRSNYKAKFINEASDKIQTVFDILNDVGSPTSNRWQIIYNQDEKVITFRTTEKLDKQRRVDLTGFDFDCHSSTQYFDLSSESSGPINGDFKNFDPMINHSMIKKSVELQKLPPPLADRLAIYPNETTCN